MLDFFPQGLASTRSPDFGERIARVASAGEPLGPLVPHSAKTTGLEYRITGIHVKDNGTTWIWPVIRYSDLYFLAFVQSEADKELRGLKLEGFSNVDDEQHLAVDYAPYSCVVGPGGRFPQALHTYTAVIKSRAGVRDFGKALQAATGSRDYKDATKSLTAAIAATGAHAAASGAVLQAIGDVANVVGGVLKGVADLVLGTCVASFTALNGDFDMIGRHDKTWENNYVRIDHRLTVRGRSAGEGT
ncbi:MAG: hypothetical protein HYY18_04820 [Planctomycetes bacterium]|nr:hypothetical protein [Planctomycetota bacterium]